ncbi:hypothetical protein [Paraburkholderia azotifigens]|uniref:DUF1488 domain-containing protein n=1 Tax=Paraburkholderia azotifigens TaxID=2057004 RepID=A0ABU9R329_9BURK
MNASTVKLSSPIVHREDLWFVVYGFGWGFRAFEISADTARTELGAANGSPQQLTLAFELGRQRIAKAVKAMTFDYRGERIALRPQDLRL